MLLQVSSGVFDVATTSTSSISPKIPETAPQDSVSPASAGVSGNSVPQTPESAPQGLPTPAVADNSGLTQDTTGQPENNSGNLKDETVSGSTNTTEEVQGESK